MTHEMVKKSLQGKLQRQSISSQELQEGITECFVLTNRNFLRRRMGDEHPVEELDAITRELAAQVFAENDISPSYAPVNALRKACLILENQLGFEADPKLSDQHQEIIGQLFKLVSK